MSRTDPEGSGVDVDSAFAYDTAGHNNLGDYSFTWNAANELTQDVSDDGTVNFPITLQSNSSA